MGGPTGPASLATIPPVPASSALDPSPDPAVLPPPLLVDPVVRPGPPHPAKKRFEIRRAELNVSHESVIDLPIGAEQSKAGGHHPATEVRGGVVEHHDVQRSRLQSSLENP